MTQRVRFALVNASSPAAEHHAAVHQTAGSTTDGRCPALTPERIMTQQTEFLKNVRETFTKAQTNAAQRLGALEGDARKVIGGLVEKGRASQKDLSEKLSKLA